jgi:hypothetical protein
VNDRSEQCSVQAGVRGDPMLGTAFPASRLLLVEQPGPWGRAGLPESRFDRAIAHRLIARLDRQHIRVVMIRRPGRAVVDGPRRWATVDCRTDRERLLWGRFQQDAELLELDVGRILDGAEITDTTWEDTEPLFAVCAHGTHDVCCAIRGRPVAAALEQVRPGRVWECSHVGGDRFAANVLVLPSGLLYGRVVASAAPALADAADNGTVLEQHLRGRVGFSPDVQAAMALLHRELPGLTVEDVRPLGSSRLDPETTVVVLTIAGETVEVQVRVERSQAQWLTCQAAQPARANVYQALTFRRLPTVGSSTEPMLRE